MSTKMLRIFTLCVLFFVLANVLVTAQEEKSPIKCPRNMSYARCGSACPAKCPVRITSFICLAIICPDKPTCWCDPGYVLKGPNHCVRPRDC